MEPKHLIQSFTASFILCKCGWISALEDPGFGIKAGKDRLLDDYNLHKKVKTERGK